MAHNVRTRADWLTGAIPTEAELDDLDLKTFQAVNGDLGGTWAPAAAIEIAGAGMIIGGAGLQLNAPMTPGGGSGTGRLLVNPLTAPNTDTSFTLPANKVYRATTAITADRVYTLTATGALEGDVVEFYCDAGFLYGLTIRNSALSTLALLGNTSYADSSYAAFMFQNGEWRFHRSNKGSRFQSVTFITGSWSFTVPRGVTLVELEMWGGGGGGAGGFYATTTATNVVRGGGGGGGAPRLRTFRSVTPGATYNGATGGGGSGGSAGDGGNGGVTTFDVGGVETQALGGHGGKLHISYANNTLVSRGGSQTDDGRLYQAWESSPAGLYQGGSGGVGDLGLSDGVRNGRNGGYADTANGFAGGGGSSAFNAGTFIGGGGGGGGAGGPGGPGGLGGNGVAANNGGPGGDGTAGATPTGTTGSGGGGGGGGGNGSTAFGGGGNGGNGGDGMARVTWVK